MSNSIQELSSLKTAWRLAFLLTGCREGASAVTRAAVEEILRHPDAGGAGRRERLLFGIVRRRSLRFPAKCELTGLAARFHALPEPGRSALTLLCLDALPAGHIQRLLDLDEASLAEAVEKTRELLREQEAPAA